MVIVPTYKTPFIFDSLFSLLNADRYIISKILSNQKLFNSINLDLWKKIEKMASTFPDIPIIHITNSATNIVGYEESPKFHFQFLSSL